MYQHKSKWPGNHCGIYGGKCPGNNNPEGGAAACPYWRTGYPLVDTTTNEQSLVDECGILLGHMDLAHAAQCAQGAQDQTAQLEERIDNTEIAMKTMYQHASNALAAKKSELEQVSGAKTIEVKTHAGLLSRGKRKIKGLIKAGCFLIVFGTACLSGQPQTGFSFLKPPVETLANLPSCTALTAYEMRVVLDVSTLYYCDVDLSWKAITGAGGGANNTGASNGGGVDIYTGMSGDTLQFRSLHSTQFFQSADLLRVGTIDLDDIGTGTTRDSQPKIQGLRHTNDCTAIVDGLPGEKCIEDDGLHYKEFVCLAVDSLCDTASEWKLVGGSMTLQGDNEVEIEIGVSADRFKLNLDQFEIDSSPDPDEINIVAIDAGDVGAGTTTSGPEMQQLTHDTDCTSITDGKRGEFCTEEDDGDLFQCIPTAGNCDTPAEWVGVGGGGGGAVASNMRHLAAEPTSSPSAESCEFDGSLCDYTWSASGSTTTPVSGTVDFFDTIPNGNDPIYDLTSSTGKLLHQTEDEGTGSPDVTLLLDTFTPDGADWTIVVGLGCDMANGGFAGGEGDCGFVMCESAACGAQYVRFNPIDPESSTTLGWWAGTLEDASFSFADVDDGYNDVHGFMQQEQYLMVQWDDDGGTSAGPAVTFYVVNPVTGGLHFIHKSVTNIPDNLDRIGFRFTSRDGTSPAIHSMDFIRVYDGITFDIFNEIQSGSGGSPVALDIDNDATNESDDITKIVAANDFSNAVTEPTADVAELDVKRFGPHAYYHPDARPDVCDTVNADCEEFNGGEDLTWRTGNFDGGTSVTVDLGRALLLEDGFPSQQQRVYWTTIVDATSDWTATMRCATDEDNVHGCNLVSLATGDETTPTSMYILAKQSTNINYYTRSSYTAITSGSETLSNPTTGTAATFASGVMEHRAFYYQLRYTASTKNLDAYFSFDCINWMMTDDEVLGAHPTTSVGFGVGGNTGSPNASVDWFRIRYDADRNECSD